MQRTHLIAVALLTTFAAVAFPIEVDACSYVPPGWMTRSTSELVGPPEGPFVVIVEAYADYSTGEIPALDEANYTVEVTDGDGAIVEGSIEERPTSSDRIARLIWTPAEPLTGTAYTMSVNFPDSQVNNTPVEMPLDVRETVDEPMLMLDRLTAYEAQQPAGATECCQAAEEGDGACVMDSCGGYMWGEECRICWATRYDYPTVLETDWTVNGGATNTLDIRLYRTAKDGTDRELVTEHSSSGQRTLLARFAQGSTFPLCLQLEAEDVIGETVHVSDVICVAQDEVETIEHETIDNSDAIDRCADGSFVQLTDDGEELPIDRPGDSEEELVDEDDPTESDPGTGTKDSPGGCSSTAGSSPSWFALIALALVFIGRGRRRPYVYDAP